MAVKKSLGGALLVGSIPFDSTDDVFNNVATILGGNVRCIPDGETGVRTNFTAWQIAYTPAAIKKRIMGGDPAPAPLPADQMASLMGDYKTCYDDVALESYVKFKQLRSEGKIPCNVKFQVCIPGPLNCMLAVDDIHRPSAEPYMEAAIARALRRIQDEIPSEDLAIQRDVAVEFCMLEHAWDNPRYAFMNPWFEPVKEGVIDSLIRNLGGGIVDCDVEMGIHLCYGDAGRQHFKEPQDTGLIVEVASILFDKIGRKITWLHLPVPKDRNDEAYFRPLLKLKDQLREHGTELYLGLVHSGDDEGTIRRLVTAQRVLGDMPFGVSTECGLGRTPKEELPGILELLKKVSSPVAKS